MSVSPPLAARVFQVRFGPDKPARGDAWPNDLRLTGSGTVEVTADAVRVLDARNEAPEKERTFAMADIANVGFAQKDNVVALRTRSDQREVLLWLASAEEVRALLELLPKTTTPEFLERQRQHDQFRQNLDAIAPRSRVTPTIVGMNVTLFLVMLAFGAGLNGDNSQVHLFFGANYGPFTWNGQEWRLLTAAFIHFGVIHLAFNMFALYNGGIWTERLYGSTRFAVIYLLSALAGSVVSGWWDPTRMKCWRVRCGVRRLRCAAGVLCAAASRHSARPAQARGQGCGFAAVVFAVHGRRHALRGQFSPRGRNVRRRDLGISAGAAIRPRGSQSGAALAGGGRDHCGNRGTGGACGAAAQAIVASADTPVGTFPVRTGSQ